MNIIFGLLVTLFSIPLLASTADSWGPYEVTSAEYKFPASVDEWVLKTAATEKWGVIYAPKNLKGPLPLLVFMHGAHGTCGYGSNPRIDDNDDYVLTGQCPRGYTPVPSHLGFGYMAERLASWGYMVVSINFNRGLMYWMLKSEDPKDEFLLHARAKMVVRHLELLNHWNSKGAGSVLPWNLQGQVDFSQVGFLGLSLGGEMTRRTAALIDDKTQWPGYFPVGLKAIVELGGVDSKKPNLVEIPEQVPWLSIVGLCDASVSPYFSFQPYIRSMEKRMAGQATETRAIFAIEGAVHAFFNTEWQVSESNLCLGHSPLTTAQTISPKQLELTRFAAMSFFRSYVGLHTRSEFLKAFDPSSSSLKLVRRAYAQATHSNSAMVLNVLDENKILTSPNIKSSTQNIYAKMDSQSYCEPCTPWNVRTINWKPTEMDSFFRINFLSAAESRNVSSLKFLNLTVMPTGNSQTPLPLQFRIVLLSEGGKETVSLKISDYSTISHNIGSFRGIQYMPQTVRIPLQDFGGIDLSQVTGLRFDFDKNTAGGIHLSYSSFTSD